MRLDTSPGSVARLRARTRDRNSQVWTSMLAGTALSADEAILNGLSLPEIEAPIVVSDELMAVKDYEMHRSHDLSMESALAAWQEIMDGFAFVKSKLDDLVALWQIKDMEEAIKIKNLSDQFAELLVLLTAEKAGELLQLVAMENDLTVQAYDRTKSLLELQQEAGLMALVVAAKEALQNAEAYSKKQLSTLRMQMELIVNGNRISAIKNKLINTTNSALLELSIGKLG